MSLQGIYYISAHAFDAWLIRDNGVPYYWPAHLITEASGFNCGSFLTVSFSLKGVDYEHVIGPQNFLDIIFALAYSLCVKL